MEAVTRTLTQERAILVARQGDPKSPAPGTLLARQKILHAELEAATAQTRVAPSGLSTTPLATLTHRQADLVRRDLRRIENEIIRVQSRLREIDAQVAADQAEKDEEDE